MSEPITTPAPDQNEAPQWARDALSKANSEAARYRVERNEYKQQLDSALDQLKALTDSKTAVEQTASTASLELQKLLIALDAGVPGDRARSIAERLQGSTEDELKADAQKLISDFGLNAPATPTRATDPSQGRGVDQQPIANTPQAQFAQLMGQLGYGNRKQV